jgi:hypothetical protein
MQRRPMAVRVSPVEKATVKAKAVTKAMESPLLKSTMAAKNKQRPRTLLVLQINQLRLARALVKVWKQTMVRRMKERTWRITAQKRAQRRALLLPPWRLHQQTILLRHYHHHHRRNSLHSSSRPYAPWKRWTGG